VGGLALLLGACGGGGGGQLTHQELVSKAGQVCTAAIAKGKSLDPQSPNYIQDALNQAKQLLQDLQALHPSAADASSYDEMTGALQKAIDDVGSGNFGDAAKQQTTYVAAATKLGLTACLQAGVAG
jgi:hypothetical protein